jgi:hypothetical protein
MPMAGDWIRPNHSDSRFGQIIQHVAMPYLMHVVCSYARITEKQEADLCRSGIYTPDLKAVVVECFFFLSLSLPVAAKERTRDFKVVKSVAHLASSCSKEINGVLLLLRLVSSWSRFGACRCTATAQEISSGFCRVQGRRPAEKRAVLASGRQYRPVSYSCVRPKISLDGKFHIQTDQKNATNTLQACKTVLPPVFYC